MKKIIFILIISCVSSLFAIDGKEIIENFKNFHDQNDSTKLFSMKVRGSLSNDRFRFFFRHDKMYRFERVIKGQMKKSVIRGDKGWHQYMSPAMKLDFVDSLEVIRLASLVDPLMLDILRDSLDYKYIGDEDVEGQDCYVLEAVNLMGDTHKYYFSKEDFRILKRVENTYTMSFPSETQFFYLDYERIDGYLLPRKIKAIMEGQESFLFFNQIEPNFKLDNSVFRMPQ